MFQNKNLLSERRDFLQKVQSEKEKDLLIAPVVKLRINCCNKKVQYYHKIEQHDHNGKYIGVNEIALAQALAQKDYDEKILKAAKEEIKAIDKYIRECPDLSVEDVYGSFHSVRRKFDCDL